MDEQPREPELPTSAIAVVPFHRGSLWNQTLFFLLVSSILFGVVVSAPATAFASPTDQVGILGLAVTLFGIAALSFTISNRDRRAEFDSTAVRWFVGKRLKRAIEWGEVKSIEYGALTTSLGRVLPTTNEYLLLLGERRKALFRLNDFQFQSAPRSIHRAIEVTLPIANARGIPVVNKAVRF